MWAIFKDENEYNEKAIIGFISFALMCVFGIVDLVTGLLGQVFIIHLFGLHLVHLELQGQKRYIRNNVKK
jgi:hypothetical protein